MGAEEASTPGAARRFVRAIRAPFARLRRWWLSRGLDVAQFPELDLRSGTVELSPVTFPPTDPSLGPGVNLYGYIHGQFGLGHTARMYARALLSVGYPVAINDAGLRIPHACNDYSMAPYLGCGSPYPVNLVFVNPDLFGALAPRLKRQGHGRTIAFWFWELETIPDCWLPVLDQVDEVWVSTRFVEDAFRKVTDKPITRVPHPVLPKREADLPRSSFGLHDEAFVFLCSFDFNSSVHRKNPWAVIRAFKMAFGGAKGGVQLLVKCSNGFRYPELLRRLMEEAAGDSRILVRDQVLDEGQLHALQEAADAYVSLHRAEGPGLGMAEAMARGKPVIATSWSGNLDFMNEHNSCLVPYRMVPVGKGEYPFTDRGTWAEPDVLAAAEWMARLVHEPELARRIGAQARQDILDTMSLRAAADVMCARLRALEPGK